MPIIGARMAALAVLAALAGLVGGCTTTPPGDPTPAGSTEIRVTLLALPSLEDTKAIDEIATAATAIVPGPGFTDYHGESGLTCDGPYAGTGARGRYLPNRVGEGAPVFEQQWVRVEDAARAAAATVEASTVQLVKNAPGDHDVWFLGPGGSSIKLAYQVNLVISGYTGCRLPEEDRQGR